MKILKILLGFLFLFIIVEIICRITFPGDIKIIDNKTNKRIWLADVIESSKKGKHFKPNLDLTVYNAWISHYSKVFLRTNALGLRGDEIDPMRQDEYRIMVVGDSITWAGYLPEEETYVYQLQEALNQRKEIKVSVVNAGIEDVGIEGEVAFVRQNIRRVRPRTVIIEFYLNDSRPPFGFESEKGLSWAWFLLQQSRFIGFLYSNIRIQLYLTKHNILGKRYRHRWFYLSQNPRWKTDPAYFKEMIEEADLDWGAAWKEGSWQLVEQQLLELKRLAADNNFILVLACFPVSFQVYALDSDTLPQKKIKSITQEKNIYFIDLLPELRKHNQEQLFYDHCHLNAKGQRIVAQELAQYLRRHNFISP